MDPVECKNGHLNDPYPETGRCVVCNLWLPKNKNIFDPETVENIRSMRGEVSKVKKARIVKLLKEAGYGFANTAPLHLTMAAEAAVKSGNIKDLEYFARQSSQLRANPKSAEDIEATEIVVQVDMGAMAKTLEVLGALSRDRSKDL